MAKFSKTHVIQTVTSTGIIPLFYHQDLSIVKNVTKACYDGGMRVFEFTNRGDFAHEVFSELIKYAAKECPELVIGIGSVVDPGTASLFLQSGANFIVGPMFNAEIAKICNRRMVAYIPGCQTVTEIGNAQEAGCDICKVFPAGNSGGPSFIKNVKAPMPWSIIMATGGVEPTEESLTAWFKAGVDCVGLGSNLFPSKMIQEERWKDITTICCEALEIVKNVKK